MKKIAPWIAAATAALLMTACSSASSGADPGGPDPVLVSDNADPVTLTVWESAGGRDEFIRQAGEAYSRNHPNVTIKYVNVETVEAVEQIAKEGPKGEGPDVFAAPSDQTGALAAAGHISPIEDADELRANLIEAAITNTTYDNVLYGVPVTLDTYALFYNKDYVDELPKTWDDVVTFSKKFRETHKGKYGFVMEPGFFYTAAFMFDEDHRLFGPNGNDTSKPNTVTETAVKGLERFQALREILDVPSADLKTAVVDSMFMKGQAAMHITGPWNISVFEESGVKFGVAPMPAVEKRGQPMGGFSNSRTMFVSSYSNHPVEAQEFAKFLASTEMLQLAYTLTGATPPAEISIDNEATLGFVAQSEFAFSTPVIAEMGSVWEPFNDAMKRIWDGADIRTELEAATESALGKK